MFKPGDIVRRKENHRERWSWPHGSKTFRVKECVGQDLRLYIDDWNTMVWAAQKFELVLPQTFNDDEWE